MTPLRGHTPVLFELKNISVSFEKHATTHRSLKHVLSGVLRGKPAERFQALHNVSLRISEGESIGIIGRNGAGKSTLLRVLTRVITPQHGSVYLADRRHIVPLLELGIGFQPDLSGRENCCLAGILMGYSRKEICARLASIAEFAELGEYIDEPVKTYSSGMYARLAFALATDVHPDVLLVDEVFGVGDEFFMEKCRVRMRQLILSGRTTVLVSHDADFLVAHCRRIVWLERGTIVRDGDPREVVAAYRAAEGLD